MGACRSPSFPPTSHNKEQLDRERIRATFLSLLGASSSAHGEAEGWAEEQSVTSLRQEEVSVLTGFDRF